MKNQLKVRLLFILVTSIGLGILLTWVYTYREDDSKQLLASLSIIVLLLFAHYFSSRLMNESILFVQSYAEGISLYSLAMVTFRIGDRLLGLSSMSGLSDIVLIVLSIICGAAYTWTIKRAIKLKGERM